MPSMMKAPHSKGANCPMCDGGACKMAEGGHVDDGKSPDEKRAARSERHPVAISGGPNRAESRHGQPHRNQRGTGDSWKQGQSMGHRMDEVRGGTSERKEEARGNLQEMKSMSKPTSGRSGFAEGGEVEDHDEELSHGLGKELLGAFESKDHKKLMSSLEACVLHCMSKNGEDDV